MAHEIEVRRIRLISVLCLAAWLPVAGCSKHEPAPTNESSAWIKADPNPVVVPVDADQGTTTVSWDTVNGSKAEVYLRVDGKPDQLFSGGPRNHQDAKWIRKGRKYDFILFAGREHELELARVSVTGQ
jgi:hypothetical protein